MLFIIYSGWKQIKCSVTSMKMKKKEIPKRENILMPKLIDVYTTLKYDLRVTVVRSEVGQMDTHTHTYIYIYTNEEACVLYVYMTRPCETVYNYILSLPLTTSPKCVLLSFHKITECVFVFFFAFRSSISVSFFLYKN